MKKLNFLLFSFFLLIFIGCKKQDESTIDNTLDGIYKAGWNSSENFSQSIPVAISYGSFQNGGTLPSSVDLTPKFPPIGSQGQLGSCVAWALAYNHKSYLDAVSKNLTSSQLFSTTNQYSPTDLFFSIDASKRGCDWGTYFDDAYSVLINRGVNTMASVPYDDQCRNTSPGNVSSAASNKIKSYRRISGSVSEIKEYLAQGIPVAIGAMVNNQFQQLKGSSVLTNLDYSGKKGGHAMMIAGYDDARNAFRIINSWGTLWGDNGYLWVDYNFLVDKFCVQGGQKSLFVAYNDNSSIIVNPPPTPVTGGPDLNALVMSDYSMYPNYSPYTNARSAAFDVKNVGNQTMNASSNWNIYYLWVNAFNANQYGTIFRGEFTTSIPQNTYQNISPNYSKINYNIAPGNTLAKTIWNTPNVGWNYFMPQITGSYYLVLFIDKGSSNNEVNQNNNIFYVTQSPKYFNSGYSSKGTKNDFNKYNFSDLTSFELKLTNEDINSEKSLAPFRTLSNVGFANAYSPEEIVSFLKHKIKNGGL